MGLVSVLTDCVYLQVKLCIVNLSALNIFLCFLQIADLVDELGDEREMVCCRLLLSVVV